MARDLIDQYAGGGEKLSQAIRGLTREDLLAAVPGDAGPQAGKWTIQQVVIHCLDSEMVSTDRLKRMIAEENPTLIGYDENKYVAALSYNEQDAGEAVAIIDATRKLFANVLRHLPPSAWQRRGTHNERGPLTVASYLKEVVDHLDHHIGFIHAKRAAMGKEMW